LTKAGAVGRACKLACSYGLESDPVVTAEFLAKPTLLKRHSNIPIYKFKVPPSQISSPQVGNERLLGHAEEVSNPQRWLDLEITEGCSIYRGPPRSPYFVSSLNNSLAGSTKEPTGLPCLGRDVPFPREASGGKDPPQSRPFAWLQ